MLKLRFQLLLCVAMLAAGPTAAQAQSWKKHTYAEDGFEVEFSGPVKIYPTDINEETRRVVVRSTNYLQDSVDDAYIVGATTYVMTDVRFEEGAKGSFNAMRCQTMDYDRPLAVPGVPRAREMSGTSCGDVSFSAVARYFNIGARFYQVLAVFKTQGGGAAGAERFVRSFNLISK